MRILVTKNKANQTEAIIVADDKNEVNADEADNKALNMLLDAVELFRGRGKSNPADLPVFSGKKIK